MFFNPALRRYHFLLLVTLRVAFQRASASATVRGRVIERIGSTLASAINSTELKGGAAGPGLAVVSEVKSGAAIPGCVVASLLWREGGGGFAMHFGLVVERMISRCPPTGSSSETNLVDDSDLICRWTCAVAPCLDWLAEVLLFLLLQLHGLLLPSLLGSPSNCPTFASASAAVRCHPWGWDHGSNWCSCRWGWNRGSSWCSCWSGFGHWGCGVCGWAQYGRFAPLARLA